MVRGRPPSTDKGIIIDVILKNKDEILKNDEDCLIAPETDPIWKVMAKDIGNIKAASLYSYVVNNRFDLKSLLLGENKLMSRTNDKICERLTKVNNDLNDDSKEKNNFMFTLTFGKSEFNDLIIQDVKKSVDKRGKQRMRTINVLKPNKWTEIMSKKIYDDHGLTHGYHFKNHYINNDKESGGFTGHCKCGSALKCTILPPLDQQEIIKIRCTASTGNSTCGKRQCRGESRDTIGSHLMHESVQSYRAKEADKLMKVGDSKEPPHLYNPGVLRNVKYEKQKKLYLDSDPLIALSKLKRSQEGQYTVRDIGLDPVKVYFWSPHQNRVYNHMMKDEDARLCIDATGKIAKRIEHADGQQSQHIFLYLGVFYSSKARFVVPAMFSERQDTVTIASWLMRWLQSGAESPKEVVCDSSKALLNACCWSFTEFKTIETYAEACMSKVPPQTYIRIDIAHYIKNWADFLKKEKKGVKKFYLYAVSQLILCMNKTEATEIIIGILILSQSKTAGKGATSLNKYLNFLNNLIAPPNVVEIVKPLLKNKVKNSDLDAKQLLQDTSQTDINGVLHDWRASVTEVVKNVLKLEKGNDLNPRHCPKIATRLLDHMKTISVWACICRDKFGYGRVPASSAPVESEFDIIKNLVIKETVRLDVAVQNLITYYSGELKIIDCSEKCTEGVSKNNGKEYDDSMDSLKLNESNESSFSEESANDIECLTNELSVSEESANDTECLTNELSVSEDSINKSFVMEDSKEDSGTQYSKNKFSISKNLKSEYSCTEDTFSSLSELSPLKNSQLKNVSDNITSSSKVLHKKSETAKKVIFERSPLKDLSSELNSTKSCLACQNGDFDNKTENCFICQDKVHKAEGCSVEEAEEGIDKVRLCISCSKSSTKKVKIGLNNFDNWRDLGRPKKKPRRSLYLNENKDLDDLFTSSNFRKLPIIKNGNDPKLQFVTLDKQKISLKNTCSADSISQIILAAVTDHENIRQFVEQERLSNDLYEMVLEILEKRIQTSTYQRRAKLFLSYFNQVPKPNLIQSLDCACNVVSLANFLFKSTPSFKEVSNCQAGCQPRIKSLPTITITQKELEKDLADVIRNHVVLPGVKCRQKNCNEKETNEIYEIGNIVVIGVDMDIKIQLQSIPETFECPKTCETYTLLGVVEYRGSPVVRNTKSIGHYVAVVKRKNNWMIYDDLQNKTINVTKRHLLCVELLIYAKVPNMQTT